MCWVQKSNALVGTRELLQNFRSLVTVFGGRQRVFASCICAVFYEYKNKEMFTAFILFIGSYVKLIIIDIIYTIKSH